MAVSDTESAPAPVSDRLPWHASLWKPMRQALAENRVAHGILVCGPPGVGKRQFGQRLLASLLCINRDQNGDACGHCARCRQQQAGTHPDISRLKPEDAGKLIKVEQVRAFGHSLRLTPQYNSGRVGWIEPAEQLSISAANSLLKTLEEPPPGCHIVLISDRVSALMATIRSRCQLWRVPSAAPELGRQWLTEQDVSSDHIDDDMARTPLTALVRHTSDYQSWRQQWDDNLLRLLTRKANPVTVAERVDKAEAAQWVDWLYRRSQQLLQASLESSDSATHTALDTPMVDAARRHGSAVLEPWCRHVLDTARLQQSNADWRLVVESLFIDLSQRIAKRSTP